MWEEELKEKWHLHNYQESDGSCVDCGEGVITFIKFLLKEQRKICAKIYGDSEVTDGTRNIEHELCLYDEIKNAPEPTGDQ